MYFFIECYTIFLDIKRKKLINTKIYSYNYDNFNSDVVMYNINMSVSILILLLIYQ